MKKYVVVVFFALVFTLLCAQSPAQRKPVVVVAPFDAKDVAQDEVDVITELFTAEYANTGTASVVDRNSFDKIREQLKFQSSDWSNADKVAQLGKALNANHVIVGQLLKFRKRIVITIKVIDVNTTTILASYTGKVGDIDSLLEKLPAICKELSNKAGAFSMKYKIGDGGEGGGIVFYVSPEGFDVYNGNGDVTRCHYLEMSKTNLGKSYWGEFTSNLQDSLGYGKSNTYKIVNRMTNSSSTPTVENCAAYRCTQYKTETSKAGEWFLPNTEEAILMMVTQLARLNAESTSDYWTSSENIRFSTEVWIGISNYQVNWTNSVRAVRAF